METYLKVSPSPCMSEAEKHHVKTTSTRRSNLVHVFSQQIRSFPLMLTRKGVADLESQVRIYGFRLSDNLGRCPLE